jgi:hypothetical protein
MARDIKGYEFKERQKDCFEAFKSLKFYQGLYGKEQVKICNRVNQFGQDYTDIYVRENAKKLRTLNCMFGSLMNFKDKNGEITGDKILIFKK